MTNIKRKRGRPRKFGYQTKKFKPTAERARTTGLLKGPLSQVEKLVCQYRNSMTYREIGELLGCSHEWARQLHKSARVKTGIELENFFIHVKYVEENGFLTTTLYYGPEV